MSRAVIVGTGRSGTGWCAAALRAAGVRCGHQDAIRHDQVLGAPIEWGDWEVEASFEATPLLPELRAGEVWTLLIVREPLAVIRSWVELGAFGPNMDSTYGKWAEVLRLHFPAVLVERTPIERAARYWHDLNAFALANADAWLRIEWLTPAELTAAVGFGEPGGVDRLPEGAWNRRRAAKRRTVEIIGDDLPSGLRADVGGLARRLGYTPP